MARSPKDYPRGWDHSKGLPPGWSKWDDAAAHFQDQAQLEKEYPGITAEGGVYGYVVMTPMGPVIATPSVMEANAKTAAHLARLKAMGDKSPVPQAEVAAQMPKAQAKERLSADRMAELAKQIKVTVGTPQIAPQARLSIGQVQMMPQDMGAVPGLTLPVPSKLASK